MSERIKGIEAKSSPTLEISDEVQLVRLAQLFQLTSEFSPGKILSQQARENAQRMGVDLSTFPKSMTGEIVILDTMPSSDREAEAMIAAGKLTDISYQAYTKCLQEIQEQNLAPQVREKALSELVGYGRSILPRDIKKASADQSLFMSRVEQLRKQKPERIIDETAVLRAIYSQEEFKEFLEEVRVQKPDAFYGRLHRVVDVYSPAELKAIIKNGENSIGRIHGVMITLVFSEVARGYFEANGVATDEGKQLVKDLFSHDEYGILGSVLNFMDLSPLITQEFITKEALLDTIIGYIEKPRMQMGADAILKVLTKYFPIQEEKKKVQEKIIEISTRPLAANSQEGFMRWGEFNLTDLENYKELLGDSLEAVKENLKKRLLDHIFGGKFASLSAEWETPVTDAQKKAHLRMKQRDTFEEFRAQVAFLLEHNMLSDAEKVALAHIVFPNPGERGYKGESIGEAILAERYTKKSFNFIEALLPFYSSSQEEQVAALKRLLTHTNLSGVFSKIQQWYPFIAENERKNFISSLIMNRNSADFAFLAAFMGKKSELKKLFSKKEIEQMLYAQLDKSSIDVSSYIENIVVFLGKKKFQDFLTSIIEKDPDSILSRLDKLEEHISVDMAKKMILSISQAERNIKRCFSHIDSWGNYLYEKGEEQFVQEFITANLGSVAEEVFWDLEKILVFFPLHEQKDIVVHIIKSNPTAALEHMLHHEKAIGGFSLQDIIDLGKSDVQRISFAPKTLSEFYSKISKMDNTPARQALLTSGVEIYEAIDAIQFAGLSDIYLAALQKQKLSAVKEKQLLTIFASFAYLQKAKPDLFTKEVASKITSIETGYTIIIQEIGKNILGHMPTQEEVNNFLSCMPSPIPLFIYFTSFGESKHHQHVLIPMMQALFGGEDAFLEWRFGKKGEEAFDELKRQKILPQNLHYAQYETWRTEGRKTLFHDALASTSEEVAKTITSLLWEKRNDLGLMTIDAEEVSLSSLEKLQNAIQENGKKLAEKAKECALLRKENPTSQAMADIEVQITELKRKQVEMQRDKQILRLLFVRPEEITQGVFLEAGRRGISQGQSLSTAIAQAKAYAESLHSAEGVLGYEEVEQILLDFSERSSEKVNFECIDTANNQLLIEIGRKPVGSCQDFAHGQLRECLLGYTNHAVKGLFLRIKDRDSLVARAITRLMDTSDGEVGLHVERIYSASASKSIDRAIFEHAFSLAEKMHVPFYVSRESQNAHGQVLATQAPEGFTFIPMPEEFSLMSPQELRAPLSYVDSAGGKKYGKYTINKLYKVVRR